MFVEIIRSLYFNTSNFFTYTLDFGELLEFILKANDAEIQLFATTVLQRI